jgi:hypothetical protein
VQRSNLPGPLKSEEKEHLRGLLAHLSAPAVRALTIEPLGGRPTNRNDLVDADSEALA